LPTRDYNFIMSKEQTIQHINRVRKLMSRAVSSLVVRAVKHDESKLKSPEVEIFEEYTPKLAGSTYGSEEYESFRKAMKPGLDHHYAHNSHHPEHFADGVHGMSLLDLLEMVCDWKAATERHNDGDILKSLEINQKRFGYDDNLKKIFFNTVKELGFLNEVPTEQPKPNPDRPVYPRKEG
jgi:hypothetical protein